MNQAGSRAARRRTEPPDHRHAYLWGGHGEFEGFFGGGSQASVTVTVGHRLRRSRHGGRHHGPCTVIVVAGPGTVVVVAGPGTVVATVEPGAGTVSVLPETVVVAAGPSTVVVVVGLER